MCPLGCLCLVRGCTLRSCIGIQGVRRLASRRVLHQGQKTRSLSKAQARVTASACVAQVFLRAQAVGVQQTGVHTYLPTACPPTTGTKQIKHPRPTRRLVSGRTWILRLDSAILSSTDSTPQYVVWQYLAACPPPSYSSPFPFPPLLKGREVASPPLSWTVSVRYPNRPQRTLFFVHHAATPVHRGVTPVRRCR